MLRKPWKAQFKATLLAAGLTESDAAQVLRDYYCSLDLRHDPVTTAHEVIAKEQGYVQRTGRCTYPSLPIPADLPPPEDLVRPAPEAAPPAPGILIPFPGRIRTPMRITADPMHPRFHAGLAALRELHGDPALQAFQRQAIGLRLQRIEAFPAAPYTPPQDEATCAEGSGAAGAAPDFQPGPEAA
jgi:hypothetical protein